MSDNALELIKQERIRQVTKERWTWEHDDAHRNDELALLAAAYVLPEDVGLDEVLNLTSADHDTVRGILAKELACRGWGALEDFFKPSGDRIRDLVKAGALIVAEIQRLQRRETNNEQ